MLHGASFVQLVSQRWEEKSIANFRSYGTRCNLELQTHNSFKTINAIVAEVEPTSTLCYRCKPKTVAGQAAKRVS